MTLDEFIAEIHKILEEFHDCSAVDALQLWYGFRAYYRDEQNEQEAQ